jgi:hypothetical protein
MTNEYLKEEDAFKIVEDEVYLARRATITIVVSILVSLLLSLQAT